MPTVRRHIQVRATGLGLLAVSLAGVTARPAVAVGSPIVELPTVEDGVYTGRVVVAGTVTYVPEELGSEGTAVMTWSGSMSGPAELAIDRGAASGTWSMAGIRQMRGTFASAGRSMRLTGTQDGSGSGTFTGTSGSYRVLGDWRTTTTVRMQADGHDLGGSGPETTTTSIAAGLHDVLLTCDQFVGRFERDLLAQLDGGDGFSTDGLSATVVLVRQPTSDATGAALDRLQVLLAEGLDWVSGADAPEAFGAEAVALLREVARAAAEVAATLDGPSPCPASRAAYLELAADLARQALTALLDLQDAGLHVGSSWLWEVTSNAVASGVVGTPDGSDLLDRVHGEVAARFTAEVRHAADLDDPSSETLVLLAMAAGFDWDLPLPDGATAPARTLLLGGR